MQANAKATVRITERDGSRRNRPPHRPLLALGLPAALLAVVLAAAGCASKKASPKKAAPAENAAGVVNTVGRESGGSRIAEAKKLPAGSPVTVRIAGTAETNLAAWPDACQLLSEDQVKAIVPGEYKLAVRGTFSPVRPFGLGKLTKHDRCEWQFGTNGSRITLDITGEEPPTLGLAVFNNAEKQAKAHKQPVYDPLADGTRCYFDGGGLSCVHADWRFTLYGNVAQADGTQDASSKAIQERWLVPAASLIGPLLRS